MTTPVPSVRYFLFAFINSIFKHPVLQSGDDRVEQARKVQQVSRSSLVYELLAKRSRIAFGSTEATSDWWRSSVSATSSRWSSTFICQFCRSAPNTSGSIRCQWILSTTTYATTTPVSWDIAATIHERKPLRRDGACSSSAATRPTVGAWLPTPYPSIDEPSTDDADPTTWSVQSTKPISASTTRRRHTKQLCSVDGIFGKSGVTPSSTVQILNILQQSQATANSAK